MLIILLFVTWKIYLVICKKKNLPGRLLGVLLTAFLSVDDGGRFLRGKSGLELLFMGVF